MPRKTRFICDTCSREVELYGSHHLPKQWLQLYVKDELQTFNFLFCSWPCLQQFLDNVPNLRIFNQEVTHATTVEENE